MNYTNSASSVVLIPEADRPKSSNTTRLLQIESLGWSSTNKKAVAIIVAPTGYVTCIDISTANLVAFSTVRCTVVWSVN